MTLSSHTLHSATRRMLVATSAAGLTVSLLASTAGASPAIGIQWHEQWLARGQAYGGELGSALGVSDDAGTVAAGEPGAQPAGAVQMYVADGERWRPAGVITPLDGQENEDFGSTVAISGTGTTMVVGAPRFNEQHGAVYIFSLSAGHWHQRRLLVSPNEPNTQGFGSSSTISDDGRTILVGAPGESSAHGVIYVYRLVAGIWRQTAELRTAVQQFDQGLGTAVALDADGTTALVGASYRASGTGAAFLFHFANGRWTQQREFVARDRSEGAYFGSAVSLSKFGGTAVVGAPLADHRQGAAYVFSRSGATWRQAAEFSAGDGNPDDFGIAVSLSQSSALVMVGAPDVPSGAAFMYQRLAGHWRSTQVLQGSSGSYLFGTAVAFAGDGRTAWSGGPESTQFHGEVDAFARSSFRDP